MQQQQQPQLLLPVRSFNFLPSQLKEWYITHVDEQEFHNWAHSKGIPFNTPSRFLEAVNAYRLQNKVPEPKTKPASRRRRPIDPPVEHIPTHEKGTRAVAKKRALQHKPGDAIPVAASSTTLTRKRRTRTGDPIKLTTSTWSTPRPHNIINKEHENPAGATTTGRKRGRPSSALLPPDTQLFPTTLKKKTSK
jgi:hypothetical protein